MSKPPTDAATVYLDSLGPSSRATMRLALRKAAAFFDSDGHFKHVSEPEDFPWHTLRFEDAQRYRAHLASSHKPRTVNANLAALRGVLRSAWRLGLMSTDDYHHARDVAAMRVDSPPAGRRVGLDEIRKLVLESGSVRDSAMIAAMYAAGLRRIEVTRLLVSDYDRQLGQLTVRGKGNKTRQVTINAKWRWPIEKWLDESGAKSSAPIFPSRHAGCAGKRMTVSGVAAIVEECRARVGVAPFTPHDMRRTLITDLIESGADLVVVQRIAGHERVETTAHYDRRNREAEDAAIDKLEGL
jgi:site-specific recombinase XerD